MGQTARKTSQSGRINFRVSPAQKHLIRLGAEKRGEKVSQFILKSVCAEAEIALADQKHFELPPPKYALFAAALDRPARVIPELQRLFAEPSVLER
jgi:uncharacterized protein (DUF1778 family)